MNNSLNIEHENFPSRFIPNRVWLRSFQVFWYLIICTRAMSCHILFFREIGLSASANPSSRVVNHVPFPAEGLGSKNRAIRSASRGNSITKQRELQNSQCHRFLIGWSSYSVVAIGRYIADYRDTRRRKIYFVTRSFYPRACRIQFDTDCLTPYSPFLICESRLLNERHNKWPFLACRNDQRSNGQSDRFIRNFLSLCIASIFVYIAPLYTSQWFIIFTCN